MSARFLPLALAALLAPVSAVAQADPATVSETERIKAETDLEKAKAELARAEADRIKALGLPSFEGKTELGTNAGAMEATLLSGRALGAAAQHISTVQAIQGKKIIVLALAESLDLGLASALDLEMKMISRLFDDAGVDPVDAGMMGGGAGTIAAISAFAGLLRSDSTLSGIDVSAIDDRMLSWAVAGRLGSNAVLPSALIGGTPGAKAKALINDFASLVERRSQAEALRSSLAAKKDPTPAEKVQLAALNSAAARHDAFAARVTTPAASGAIPLISAGRVADILTPGTPVLRLHVDRAGGSLVNTRNIATTFGLDPLKISGGVIASYLLTDPSSGTVAAADTLACHTTLTSIRRVQERRVERRKGKDGNVIPMCASLMP